MLDASRCYSRIISHHRNKSTDKKIRVKQCYETTNTTQFDLYLYYDYENMSLKYSISTSNLLSSRLQDSSV